MSEALHIEPELSPVKRALHEIRSLRARVQELETAQHEAIAIIGTGLRFPGGVVDEASFWELLSSGRMRSPRYHADVGTGGPTSMPIPIPRVRCARSMEDFSKKSIASTRRSSGSRRAKQRLWTLSIG